MLNDEGRIGGGHLFAFELRLLHDLITKPTNVTLQVETKLYVSRTVSVQVFG